MQIHAALLALHTNRPVKIVYSREESFTGHVHRHPARIWCEHRANRDGKLVNVRMRILLDGGAYASSLDRGDLERRLVRVRAVRGRERADRVDRRLHEQPAVRRDARLRRGADLLRRRGADGQAGRRARHRPRRAAAAERARARRPAADRPEDRGLAAGRRGDPPLRRARAAAAGGAAARPAPPAGRRRQHDERRRRPARRRLRRRLQEHLLLRGLRRLLRGARPALRRRLRGGALRRRRGRAGRLERDRPDGADGARHRRRAARAAGDVDASTRPARRRRRG